MTGLVERRRRWFVCCLSKRKLDGIASTRCVQVLYAKISINNGPALPTFTPPNATLDLIMTPRKGDSVLAPATTKNAPELQTLKLP
ncbi:hypothetical protein PC119_g26926 [Phytophthora cactorum]|uniref:Uncharacterized protein n=1 Tax=Phytophthora cactorum TaxID=29920 RepID=A0A8T1AF41_9STRA|nr:hypothetical protein PC114_g27124 [Phytophthora cactorum]KAG2877523.1 hypothetical protein PC117_g27073 [Phytophthora cactorum]KAG2958738.1 hypothetical protein PC119_g26926 [Phytophthora cactorum]KAG2967204.1 hypothetical protein PC120_g26987 [Phytophthora cactorum]KAG3122570.1 hypothetical protein C6341_g26916 [Phytophthora cactorum]